MWKNVGTADRVVRLVIGGTLVFLAATPALSGTAAYVSLAVAAYLIITAVLGSCLIFKMLDVDSHNKGSYHSGEDPFDGRGGD